MKLSIDSWHAKLYRFTYGESLPESLCPYFWKVVFAAIIFLPLLVWSMGAIIMEKRFGDAPWDGEGYLSVSAFAASVVINSALFLVTSMVLTWFVSHNSWIVAWGCVGYFIVGIVLIGWGYDELKKRRKPKKRTAPTHSENIVTEFIKAKVNRYCPRINWYK